ncbi:MAG: hypothetical protein KAS07_04960, partial [Candidatus Pacebacteria bacterium]|nr:hypothetical protein [Candidatus Paceibacterota bacterium]
MALPVFAANLFVSPSSGVYTEGDVFNVLIYVTSDDQAMNAIEGTLTYPQQYLQAQTLSTTNSVISFWIKAPSAADGTVKFEGIVPNPGFTGSFGKVLTIPFKALQPGVAQLSFSSGSVLANDGLATELLSVTQGAVFVIEEAVIEEIPPEEDGDDDGDDDDDTDTGSGDDDGTSSDGGGEIPKEPHLKSSTHPDQNIWYVNKEVEVSWKEISNIDGIRISISPDEDGEPTQNYDPYKTSETFMLDDGIWYTQVQFKNTAGWGDVGNFRVMIDTQEPSEINVIQVASDEMRPGVFSSDFRIEAFDLPSGIEYFEITLDDGESVTWYDDGTNIFSAKGLVAGEHSIAVKGY